MIRSFDTCIPGIMRYFINPLREIADVDIFLYLSMVKKVDPDFSVDFKMRESKADTDKIISVLKPKSYTIYEYTPEIQKKELDGVGFDADTSFDQAKGKLDKSKRRDYAYNGVGMYYKIMMCNRLKSEYEVKNGFTYDFVWRARLDYIFLDPLPIDEIDFDNKDNLYLIRDRNTEMTKHKTNDKFFGGSSLLMNKVTGLYNQIRDYHAENALIEGQNLFRLYTKKIGCRLHLIGHQCLYYKCQERHEFRPNGIKVYIDLEDTTATEVGYMLLSEGYTVHTPTEISILGFYTNYSFGSDKLEELYRIGILRKNDPDGIRFKKIIRVGTEEGNGIHVIHNGEDHTDIIHHLVRSKHSKGIIEVGKLNTQPNTKQLFYYQIPDRGGSIGYIKEIKKDTCIVPVGNKSFEIKKKFIKPTNLEQQLDSLLG